MYKRILVPTDGSDAATSGLREAIKLAKDQNAEIRLVHVVDVTSMIPPDVYGVMVERITAEARSAGASVLARTRELVPPDLSSVGVWYDDFRQVKDAEVRKLLHPIRRRSLSALPAERPSTR
jgi:nucleotide-binding universal stress UspA family protein